MLLPVCQIQRRTLNGSRFHNNRIRRTLVSSLFFSSLNPVLSFPFSGGNEQQPPVNNNGDQPKNPSASDTAARILDKLFNKSGDGIVDGILPMPTHSAPDDSPLFPPIVPGGETPNFPADEPNEEGKEPLFPVNFDDLKPGGCYEICWKNESTDEGKTGDGKEHCYQHCKLPVGDGDSKVWLEQMWFKKVQKIL